MVKPSFLITLVLLTTTLPALASDCSISKTFRLQRAQQLTGSFHDPTGAILSGLQIELSTQQSKLRSLTTDNLGKYDFGEIPPGEYKVRVVHGNNDFCAPTVRCKADGCRFEPRLKLNPKNPEVTVY